MRMRFSKSRRYCTDWTTRLDCELNRSVVAWSTKKIVLTPRL